MRTMRMTGTLLAAVCVVGLVAAASAMAHATNNPQWQILSKILKAGETVEVTGEANGVQKLKSTGLTIECTKFTLAAGAKLIGSNAPAPGTSLEIIVYSGCTVAGFTTCKINGAAPGTIETRPLFNLLVFLTKLGALDENALESGTLFEPEAGNLFATFTLSEPGLCPLTGPVTVEGSGVIAKNLEADVLSLVHEIEAPTTAITSYFVNEPGLITTEKSKIKITVGGLAATYSGKARIWLLNDDLWEVFN